LSLILFRAKNFHTFIKTKLKDINHEVQDMALDLTDYFMDEGKMPLFNQISSKDFLGTLVNILKTRGTPTTQEKILYLLKKWGLKFEKNKDIIPTFSDLYEQLKNNNAVFPNITTPPYKKYVTDSSITENKTNYVGKNSDFDKNKIESNIRKKSVEKSQNQVIKRSSKEKISNIRNNSSYKIDENKQRMSKPKISSNYDYKNFINLSPSQFTKKYKVFVEELIIWMENITLANVIN
jgi:hypothetical protein